MVDRFRIQLPGGRQIDVEAPDPQSAAATARSIFERESGGAAPQAASAPQRPIEDPNDPDTWAGPFPADRTRDMMNAAVEDGGFPEQTSVRARPDRSAMDVVGSAINRGTADIVGTPGDLYGLYHDAFYGLLDHGTRLFTGGAPLFDAPEYSDYDTRLIPTGDDLFQGYGDAVEALGGERALSPEDLNSGDRMLYSAVRYGSQAPAYITGTGAVGGGARTAANAGRNTGMIAGAFDELAAPYRANPVRATIQDVGTGAGAGIAAQTAEDVGADGPIAQTLAMILGGMGGRSLTDFGLGAADMSVGAFNRNAADPVTGESRYATNRAGEYLQNEAYDVPAARENLETARADFDVNGAPQPSSMLLTRDPGLIGVDRGLRTGSVYRGEFPGQDRRYQRGMQEELSDVDAQRADAPEGTNLDTAANPRRVTDYAETTAANRRNAAAAERDTAAADLETQNRALTDQGGELAARRDEALPASRQLDEVVVGELDRRQGELSARRNEIDPEGTNLRDPQPILDILDDVETRSAEELSSVGGDAAAPLTAELRRRLQTEEPVLDRDGNPVLDEKGNPEMQAVNVPTAFRTLDTWTRQLSDAIGAARREGRFSDADRYTTVRQAIYEEVDRMAEEGDEAAARAIEYYREEFRPYFGRGEGARFRRDINSEGRIDGERLRDNTPPENTAERFLRAATGRSQVAADLRRILDAAENPQQGIDAARRYLFASAARTVKADGTINPQALRNWIDQHTGTLESFPEIRADFDALMRDVVNGRETQSRLGERLRAATENVRRTEADIQNGWLGLVIGRDPHNAMQAVFSAGDPATRMRELVDAVENSGDPTLRLALDRAAYQYFEGRLTRSATEMTDDASRPLSGGVAENFLDRHEEALAELYRDQPEKLQTLRRVRRMLDAGRQRMVQATPGSATGPNLVEAVVRVARLPSRLMFGLLKGGGITASLRDALQPANSVINQDAVVEYILFRATQDPEVLDYLLTYPVQESRVRPWLTGFQTVLAGSEYAREQNEPDDQ